MLNLSKHQQAIIALIITNIIWGAASPIFKWSLGNVGTFTLAFLRFFIAAYIILPFTYKKLSVKREHIYSLIIASTFGITLNISLFFLALPYTASINVPIIGSSGPIMILFASAIFLKEKLKRKVINGMLLSLIGILIIIIVPVYKTGIDTSIFGNLLLIAATISTVVHVILLKKIAKFYDAMTLTFWSFIISSMTFLPFMLNEIRVIGFLPNLGIHGIIGILFGAFLSSAIAYGLYQFAVKYMNANETGIFTYLDPFPAIIIAIPLLGEKLTLEYMLGAILVFLGIYLAEGRIHYHPIHLLRNMSKGLKTVI